MTWRDEIVAELAQIEAQLMVVDENLSPAVVRQLRARMGELHVKRDRPVDEQTSAQVCRSVDYVIDHAGTLKAFVLQTSPLEMEHARAAARGIQEHLDNILQHLPDVTVTSQ